MVGRENNESIKQGIDLENRDKILIITYYWPPAGGMGVQRWLRLSKYLAQQGCQVYVYSPLNPSYPILDKDLVKEVDPEIIEIKRKILEPYSLVDPLFSRTKRYKAGQIDKKENQSILAKLMLTVRANLFIPDARSFWINPSAKFLSEFVRKEQIGNIISTGPPHSTHRIAQKVKRKNKSIRWIADFRDPWTEIDYFDYLPLTKWARRIHEKMEREVLTSSDKVVSVTPTLSKRLSARVKNKVNVETIFNGFDPDDFSDFGQELPENFTISHIGSVNQDRNIIFLWKLLDEMLSKGELEANRFCLNFVGEVDPYVKQKINGFSSLKKNVYFLGQAPRSEALQAMINSHLLLLIINQNEGQEWRVPGKIFEYMVSGRPVLCVSNQQNDASRLVNDHNLGESFLPNAEGDLKEFILKQVSNSKKKASKKATFSFAESKFAYPHLAKEYLKLLE